MGKRRTLQLKQDEMDELLKILKESPNKNSQLYRRSKVIFLKAEGKSLREIANETGLTKQAIYHILKLFEKDGLNGIIPKKRGKKEKFSEEDKQKIVNLVNQFSPSEFGIPKRYWTLRTIARAMKKIYNVKISINSIRKILNEGNVDLKKMRDKFKKIKLIDYLKS